ncbi:MAG TPA: hypothetical protein VI387_05710, partial [Candidatus Brocadiales bacterium]|nr:hypothetical protein [Candidatus Brocadiales bacterium]
KEEKHYDVIMTGTPIFSPDSKRVAYGAGVGDKRFVVVDGKEERHYDVVIAGTLIFGSDSKRVAYGAEVGNKRFAVVDEKEGKQYDDIVTFGGGRIIFDSPDSLHYLALSLTIEEGSNIYFVEERIK